MTKSNIEEEKNERKKSCLNEIIANIIQKIKNKFEKSESEIFWACKRIQGIFVV